MQEYKREFIRFMVRSQVLTFGDFTTKSGRKTPYFVNTGRYRTGAQMNELGRYYADAILASGIEFDLLFGPAYKGIPLVVACSMELARRGKDVPFCFDRKETKDHGEGGRLIGQVPADGDRVLIVEDVTTAGTSISQTVPLLQAAARVRLAGLIVSVDRKERVGTTNDDSRLSALQRIGADYSMPTFAIVTVDEIMSELRGQVIDGKLALTEELYAQMGAYRAQYGA